MVQVPATLVPEEIPERTQPDSVVPVQGEDAAEVVNGISAPYAVPTLLIAYART